MLRTPSRGGAGTAVGMGRAVSMVWDMRLYLRCRHPRRRVTQYSRDARCSPRGRGVLDPPPSRGDDSCVFGNSEAYHPSNSALRGSSTDLTFSSLIAPFAMRSLRSPSVAPEILVR